ncbi:RNA-binding protein [Rhodoligotrophos defluvii]|uniref:RNA-binding protein n=1 Tax=Rhodoligotrophos defluvii TaxID=2561934 RepID=UPI00148578E0|nr:RNA-binding protein [Rhodoligotrophos defluvii]
MTMPQHARRVPPDAKPAVAGDRAKVERRCIVTRDVREPEDMVRFVLAPDASVTPDLKRELPGRGVWITARRHLVEEAVRKKLFARGFKQQVTVADDLADRVAKLMADRALGLLSFANRAGLVATGFEKVAEAIASGRTAVLLQAADGAMNGRQKLAGKLAGSGRTDVEIIEIFTGEQLSLALGRSNVIHASLGQDRLTKAFLKAAHRYEHFTLPPGRSAALQDR